MCIALSHDFSAPLVGADQETLTIALKKRMAGENQMNKFSVVSCTFVELAKLIDKGSLKKWTIPKRNNSEHLLYPDVIFAVAVSPVSAQRRLELRAGPA